MEPPRKKKHQSGKCKVCLAVGVSHTSLVAWKHERKVTKKCREVQETWTREQTATPAGVTVVVAAAVGPPKVPQTTPQGEVKSSIGATAAAQENFPRGSAGNSQRRRATPQTQHRRRVLEGRTESRRMHRTARRPQYRRLVLAGRMAVRLRRLEARRL